MTKTQVFGIRLDPRQAWAWKRLGQKAIRNLIAPVEICVQCSHQKAEINTRNGWFCYPCQDDLDQQSLLPSNQSALLVKQNQDLLNQIKRLQSQANSVQTNSDIPMEHQPSLFDSS
ncbi:MAG: hypothetical protein GY807_04955 [Gammaproteobacteria bacterium]|nr:hypothetical protein [Gammaproteobacteria bacterium]